MFVYCADTWCDSCGAEIIRRLEAEGYVPSIVEDSDHWPQSALEEETDGPDHCASVAECLEGIDLGDYGLAEDAPLFGAECRTIGALLSDGLTSEGMRYLAEMLAESDPTPYQSALHRFWRETYSSELEEFESALLLERAREMGADHGRAAASWFFDGNTARETYAAVLRGLDEGDPEILDRLPSTPLSGEFADEPTPAFLLRDLDIDVDSLEDWEESEIMDAYEDAFYSASQSAIEETARKMLREDDPS